MIAGTPLWASVPCPNVPRKRAAKYPRPFPGNNSRMVSKGRAEALPLVVSRGLSGGKSKSPLTIFLGKREGIFF